LCALVAPVFFRVPKRGTVEFLDAEPPEDARAEIQRAIESCPTRALFVTEVDEA
jgi:ferredoxin